MNKAELIDRIAAGSQLSKSQAEAAVDIAVNTITAALKKGDRVSLPGFGTFSVSSRKPRIGRNPRNGEVIKIATKKISKFTPGRRLSKAVDRPPANQDPFVSAIEELSRSY